MNLDWLFKSVITRYAASVAAVLVIALVHFELRERVNSTTVALAFFAFCSHFRDILRPKSSITRVFCGTALLFIASMSVCLPIPFPGSTHFMIGGPT